MSQEIIKKCCSNPPVYHITYRCGQEPDEELLVCKVHYKDEAFHRFAVKTVFLNQLESREVTNDFAE